MCHSIIICLREEEKSLDSFLSNFLSKIDNLKVNKCFESEKKSEFKKESDSFGDDDEGYQFIQDVSRDVATKVKFCF